MLSYEELFGIVQRLTFPATSDDRQMVWCTESETLGIARDALGHVEVFIVAEPINTSLRSIRENLEHETWYRRGGDPVRANRLALPAAPHFEQVAAFVCVELLRNGVREDPVGAFQRTERIIELAIQRLRIGDDAVLGLFGEMVLLMALAQTVPDDGLATVIDSWTGNNNAARDLQLPSVGVEVKTTTSRISSHRYQGVHQCEVGHGTGGTAETSFFVASVGVEEVQPGSPEALTLPQVIDRVLTRIEGVFGAGAALAGELVGRVKTYGAPEEGYDHRSLPRPRAFERPFRTTFLRLYDMTDPAMLVLSSEDLAVRPFVAADSVQFRADFPNRVTGDLNPVTGLYAAASAILVSAGLAPR